MNKILDERHEAYYDIFKFTSGQVNVSKIYPGTIIAWHRHQHQWDEWFIINGLLKVGIKEEGKDVKFSLLAPGERIWIKNNIWHGYMALRETILVYHTTTKYDPKNPDEERTKVGKFGESWEVVAK